MEKNLTNRPGVGLTCCRVFSLLLNLALVGIELFSIPVCWQVLGWEMFTFYTQDFNMLGMAACALTAWHQAAALRTGRPLPLWVKRFKFVATCCLVMILGTVVFILAPLYGPGGYALLLFSGEMLSNHLVNPLLAAVSLLLFERETRLPLRTVGLALLPTLAYGGALLALNLGRWVKGPYSFFYIYEQTPQETAAWFALILASNLVYAGALWLLGGNRNRRVHSAMNE